ncbi:GSCOCG00012534001-RA-CDS, partial [Cotesia congregata]
SKWKKDRSCCIRQLLKDKTTNNYPEKEPMVAFWERIMTENSLATPGVVLADKSRRDELKELWGTITPDEVGLASPSNGTSPGPDGLSAKTFKSVPYWVWAIIFNIFMLCGKVPEYLLESKTTLIPKKDGASEPGDFRPITVSSVITRTFHKVLANRMNNLIKLDPRQRGFRSVDGCSENIFLVDLILRFSRLNSKPLFMASIDVAKAFDSVSHQAIVDTLRSFGVPLSIVDYIAGVYRKSTTRLQCAGWTSDLISPKKGVKQGDPLSPIIFNMVLDRLFSEIPEEIGCRLGGVIVNALAYADDLLLFASTSTGLQRLLDISNEYLSECGLAVNASKCATMALKSVPKEKKTVIDANQTFLCRGQRIPALKRSDEWKYLGVPFSPTGKLCCDPCGKLNENLKILKAAPLKPQQRLFVLRTTVIPSLYHLLVLGNTTISLLNKLDKMVRASVRNWLMLPHDVANAYFHSDVLDGGLSIPSFRWTVPLQRFHRLSKLKIFEDKEVPELVSRFLKMELSRVERRLNDHGNDIRTLEQCKTRIANILHNSNDGKALSDSRGVVQQHRWITDGNLMVSGSDFINMNKLRINAIPLRVRLSRGRVRDKHCRAGCNDAETLNHVLQLCHRTHTERIKRHDACLDYLLHRLPDDVRVEREPVFDTPFGKRKPDVIIVSGNKAVVVDAVIAGERANLDMVHYEKIRKYKILTGFIIRRYNVRRVDYTSLTLSSRGIWCKKSFDDLCQLGIANKADAKILSVRALIGGLIAIRAFNRATYIRRK